MSKQGKGYYTKANGDRRMKSCSFYGSLSSGSPSRSDTSSSTRKSSRRSRSPFCSQRETSTRSRSRGYTRRQPYETWDNYELKYNKKEYSENYEEELYCWDCDKWTNTREQMQAHIASANHLKNTSKVQQFECKLCLIQTTCQASLDAHFKGKGHLKRQFAVQEGKRVGLAREECKNVTQAFKEGEDIKNLRKDTGILQNMYQKKVQELNDLQRVVDGLNTGLGGVKRHIRRRNSQRNFFVSRKRRLMSKNILSSGDSLNWTSCASRKMRSISKNSSGHNLKCPKRNRHWRKILKVTRRKAVK